MARDIDFTEPKGGYIIVQDGKLALLSLSDYDNLTEEEKRKISQDLEEWRDSHED